MVNPLRYPQLSTLILFDWALILGTLIGSRSFLGWHLCHPGNSVLSIKLSWLKLSVSEHNGRAFLRDNRTSLRANQLSGFGPRCLSFPTLERPLSPLWSRGTEKSVGGCGVSLRRTGTFLSWSRSRNHSLVRGCAEEASDLLWTFPSSSAHQVRSAKKST